MKFPTRKCSSDGIAVVPRIDACAVQGLCVKYVTKIEDMERTMSKISSSNVSKVSKKMSALRKKLQAKSQELEGVQRAYQQVRLFVTVPQYCDLVNHETYLKGCGCSHGLIGYV